MGLDYEVATMQDSPGGLAPGKQTLAETNEHHQGDGAAAQEIEMEREQSGSQRMDPWPSSSLLLAMGLDVDGESHVERSEGEPLAASIKAPMERSFGADFSQVRVHQGGHVNQMGAKAYAQGSDLHFAPGEYAPESQQGRELIGHELAHVVQQAEGRTSSTIQGKGGQLQDDPGLEQEADEKGARAARGELAGSRIGSVEPLGGNRSIQRRIRPEDVAPEMVGREFTLTADDGGLRRGTIVRPSAWSNASRTVPVLDPRNRAATVQKTKLRPRNPAATGMHRYSANIDTQAAAAERADQAVTAWRAREGEYRNNRPLWTSELARFERLATRSNEALNRRVIQETQFNRFDSIIQTEVNAANAAAGLRGEAALDPNILKSMIFQESQMGTAGEHLGDPSSPVKTRFNVGQTIDSSGSQLLMLMEREHTALIARFHLANLRTDLEAAMRRKNQLEGARSRNATQEAELQALNAKARQNWEYFIWGYVARGQSRGFADAVDELFQSPGAGRPPRNEDYGFWIHLMVMWLFEKKKNVRTWAEAIRAYNGGGTRAAHYRDAVIGRRNAAAAGGATGYVPDGI